MPNVSERYKDLLGEGDEKLVFAHPDKADQVVGVYKEGGELYKNTPEYIQGQFYLNKVLHLIFPSNIPDILEVTNEPKMVTRQRIVTDELHQGLSQTQDLVKRESSREKMREFIDHDPQAQAFLQELLGLGINIDKATKNFSLSADGKIIYLDDIRPWNKEGVKWYNPTQLLQVIEEKLEGEDRVNAVLYLGHLEALYEKNPHD